MTGSAGLPPNLIPLCVCAQYKRANARGWIYVVAVAAALSLAAIVIRGNSRSTVVYMESNNFSNKLVCSIGSHTGAGHGPDPDPDPDPDPVATPAATPAATPTAAASAAAAAADGDAATIAAS